MATSSESSTLKDLIVCIASELPALSERTTDKMYFLFDKLELYIGQSRYNDPFAIVEKIPDSPVWHMLYICLDDGYVKTYSEYSVLSIAKVQTDDMLETLKQCGTTFFTNSDKRYLDKNRSVLHLPYANGEYELTVDLARNLEIDSSSIIAFNPDTNMFEFTNHYQDYDLVFGTDYHAIDTNTVKMTVSEHRISADIKISQALDNIIKSTDDGIYAVAKNAVTIEEFNSWKTSFQDYKAKMEHYLNELISKVDSESEIGSANLDQKITASLETVIPDVQSAIDNFDSLAASINNNQVETECKAYTDEKFDEAEDNLNELILSSGAESWSSMDEE